MDGGLRSTGQPLVNLRRRSSPRPTPREASGADPRLVLRPARAAARSVLGDCRDLVCEKGREDHLHVVPAALSTASAVRGRRGLAASSAWGGRPRPSRRSNSIAATRDLTSGILTSTRCFLPQPEHAVVTTSPSSRRARHRATRSRCHRVRLLLPPRVGVEPAPGRRGRSRSRAWSRPRPRAARPTCSFVVGDGLRFVLAPLRSRD